MTERDFIQDNMQDAAVWKDLENFTRLELNQINHQRS